ncbi:iron-sulfur cluster assembly scaffold protein [Desulfoluna spongiiphila]|uniref:Nitrogen fixation protein NifU n=1 Tax=Desulfoluna spongiiphila TaxID=419481 RepID=A0A1G5J504_9BACT|nr:iron-sulfur cluster assembly scaffold protein [Desulfoluna spongiiphila]SCY83372.1 nitrogen fixation protein NifU [Desulfoluna spongiiphila]
MDHHEQNFLEQHSDEYIEMAYSYERLERVENPDGYGKRVGDCGDTVEMFLTIEEETIKHVSIQIDGCMNTIACANTVASMTEGRSLDEAWEVTPEKVAGYLKTLEEDHFHCAELSVGAFFLALNDHRQKTRNGWKKTYTH